MKTLARIIATIGLTLVAVVPPHTAGAAPEQPPSYCPDRDAYEVTDCADEPQLPAGPLSGQLAWALDQVSGDAASVTAAEVREHFSPEFLAQPRQSPREIVVALRDTLERFGPMTFQGFAYPPRSTEALALVRSGTGLRGEIPIAVDDETQLINSMGVSEASPVLVPEGPLSGWFDIGERRLFMRCTGTGAPTVVFENGLTTDWYDLHNQLAESTTVCSYDPARQGGPMSRSDSPPLRVPGWTVSAT